MEERPSSKTYGPSWWDVERELKAIRTDFRSQEVRIAMAMMEDPHSGRISWHVTVQCAETWYPTPKAVIGASHGFKGNGGAETFPAALWFALRKLYTKLSDRADEAQQAAMF